LPCHSAISKREECAGGALAVVDVSDHVGVTESYQLTIPTVLVSVAKSACAGYVAEKVLDIDTSQMYP
jgi:hypothetical protein